MALTIWVATFVFAMQRRCVVCHACPFPRRCQLTKASFFNCPRATPFQPCRPRCFLQLRAATRSEACLNRARLQFEIESVEPPPHLADGRTLSLSYQVEAFLGARLRPAKAGRSFDLRLLMRRLGAFIADLKKTAPPLLTRPLLRRVAAQDGAANATRQIATRCVSRGIL